MNIKKIIREEIDDFDWIENGESVDDLISNTLDSHFGISFNNSSADFRDKIQFNTDESPYTTYRKVKNSSARDLYKILTKTPKYKTLFNRDYYRLSDLLKSWKRSRVTLIMLTSEVQEILRDLPQDTGPR